MIRILRARAAGALALVAAACLPIPEPAPTDSTTGVPPIVETTPPGNPPPPPPETDPIVGPTGIPGELTFDFESFGGVSVGAHPRQFGTPLGLSESACGDAVFPTVYEPDAGWEVQLYTNWEWALSVSNLKVEAIKLTSTSGIPTEPLGPIGPYGVRLGTSWEDLTTAFAAETDFPWEVPFDTSSGDKYLLRMIAIAGPGLDEDMVVTEAEGHVVAVLWGKNKYVNGDYATPFCVG